MNKLKKARNIVFLVLMGLINAFILVEAGLPGGLSSIQSGIFADKIGDSLNENIEVEQKVIPVESISISSLNPLGHDIIVGTTERLDIDIKPSDASDKSIKYSVDKQGVVNLVKAGPNLRIEALGSVGDEAIITATSSNNKIATWPIKIIDRLKPKEVISNTTSYTLPLYTSKPIDLLLKDGDNLDQSYLMRDYDISKVEYEISDPSIAEIKYGHIIAKKVGSCRLTIEGISQPIPINIEPNINPYVELNDFTPIFDKSNINVRDLDYINDHNELGTKVNIAFIGETPSDTNFAYECLDPLYAKVYQANHIVGYKTNGKARIKVIPISNPNKAKVISINCEKVLPTSMNLIIHGRQDLMVGQSFKVQGEFEPFNVTDKSIKCEISNSKVAKAGEIQDIVDIVAIGDGESKISVTSIANPSLSKTIDVKFTKKTAINDENRDDFEGFIRKAIGHFGLFLFNGIITTLAMCFVLEDKAKSSYIKSTGYSLAIGFGIAWLSEFIQIFAKRGASLSDVMLDFSGFFTAGIIICLILYLIKHMKELKKEAKDERKD